MCLIHNLVSLKDLSSYEKYEISLNLSLIFFDCAFLLQEQWRKLSEINALEPEENYVNFHIIDQIINGLKGIVVNRK